MNKVLSTNTSLAALAKQFKTLDKKNAANEKNTIANIIEQGKILFEASEQCEHSTYMDWVQTECGCSHQSALNYRSVYRLTQIPNVGNLGELNISIKALYKVARLVNVNDFGNAVVYAVIETARNERVSFQKVYEIHNAVAARMAAVVAKPALRPTPCATPDENTVGEQHTAPHFAPRLISLEELVRAIVVLRQVTADNHMWPDIVEHLGIESLRDVSAILKTVFTAQYDRSVARLDRTRAKEDAKLAALVAAE